MRTTIQLAMVAVVMVVALVTTRDASSLWPLSFVAMAVLRWKGPWPPFPRR